MPASNHSAHAMTITVGSRIHLTKRDRPRYDSSRAHAESASERARDNSRTRDERGASHAPRVESHERSSSSVSTFSAPWFINAPPSAQLAAALGLLHGVRPFLLPFGRERTAARDQHLAARALVTTAANISTIAAQVGYESEAAFNRAFKPGIGHAAGALSLREQEPSRSAELAVRLSDEHPVRQSA